ncbi:multicopper oxidase family protein [Streptomyces mexicanus]|uniref:Multicopper oxidase domain-containing protein n=1 Tax=Streptomyces mexicanus TaxID=178566 RepID=A0A7X1I605_9ACTN|nr:multicopper oxidase domain-containing protein [Streptomyces mexicanus]MBC2869414.1 multicopper oxidase domain-containing protein [Streptomyces mexicanus]
METASAETPDSPLMKRRTLLRGGAVAGLGALMSPYTALAAPQDTGPGAAEPSADRLILAKFKDPLRTPPVLRPAGRGGHDELTVRMRTADVLVHSDLPPVRMWTYEGSYPGPTIETVRGRRLRVTWENHLTGTLPVTAVDFGQPGGPLPDPLSNYPGTQGCREVPGVADLRPWAAVHVHGMLTGGGNDGWMENAVAPGDVQLSAYPNDQAATTLWYHDHTHHVSRFSVYAGLAGLFVCRDEEERALGLPKGRYEVPLVLSDRNFALDASGALTGRLVHKVEMVGTTLMRAHAAPYTLVNGVIWPYLEVEPRWYRFRIANTANSRIYRLMLLADGEPVPGAFQVIGTDQGLIDTPLPVEGALNLSSGERVDVLVDFSAYRGRLLKLVNTMEGVPPGSCSTRHDLLEPDVMQFRVAARGLAGRFTPPAVLSPTFERPAHHDLPHDSAPRWVVIVGPGTENVPELWEMEEVADAAGLTFPAAGIVQVRDAEGTLTTLRRTALHYDDGRAFTVAHGSTEIWKYLNLTASPHPMHIHLAHFHVLSREHYDVTGFDRTVGGTARPAACLRAGELDPHERGLKDTVRVGTAGQIRPGPNGTPGELVTVAVSFPVVGRGVHHCHMLEHEQHMVRPLVVTAAGHGHAGGHH